VDAKDGTRGLEHALALLRSHMGPLIDGVDCQRYREVLRCAKALANAVTGWEKHHQAEEDEKLCP
jgi:hypothetical protein